MSRRSQQPSAIASCVGPLVVAVLMAGVAFTTMWKKPVDIATMGPVAPTSTKRAVPPVPVTRVLLGVSVSGGSTDRVFALTLPDNTVDEDHMPEGWRLTSLGHGKLSLVEHTTSDGVVALKDGASWNVPLRTKKGVPYQQVMFLGLFDATHAAVVGSNGGRVLLSVSRVGTIEEVAAVSETMNVLGLRNGDVWLSSFVAGEGLESPPVGPSSLVRVDISGVATTLVTDSNLIVSVAAGPQNAYAYGIETGEVIAQSGLATWRGRGKPMAWKDAQTLIIADGTVISTVDLKEGKLTQIATLPLAPSAGKIADDGTIL